jgi:hypothetical protein
MEIAKGVTVAVSVPTTYTMHYLNGSFTYTEPFVVTHFPKDVVDRELGPYDTLINGAAAFFANTGSTGAAATFGISAGLAAIIALAIKVIGGLLRNLQLDADGGFTYMLAYHYSGNSSWGIDPTATPIPGANPTEWCQNVNNVMQRAYDGERANRDVKTFSAIASRTSAPAPKPAEVPLRESKARPLMLREGDDSDFYDRFKGCLEAQGLPVPSSAFGTVQSALATLAALYNCVHTFGTSVTIAELIEAGTLGEVLIEASSLTAAYYLGACIGCAINAGVAPWLVPPQDWA